MGKFIPENGHIYRPCKKSVVCCCKKPPLVFKQIFNEFRAFILSRLSTNNYPKIGNKTWIESADLTDENMSQFLIDIVCCIL